MAITDQDWEIERKRLEQVRRQMEEERDKLSEVVHERKADVTEFSTHFWDEISVNTLEFDDLVETAASIRSQNDVLNQQERSYRIALKNWEKLEKLYKTPYFARIDFLEQGYPDTENVYIGVGSFIDEDTHEILVYDWRAPISGMFYDYTPGPVEFQAPDGPVRGEMTLKRQYLIKNGELENMFDTGISIGDEMLQYMLSRHAHEKMSSIVTTIQQEQNKIIRNDKARILIVQGAAGSGKTSVALQRVAYLLYKYRNSLSADNMVLFSPNSLFNDYVSNVLPELGEANMQQTTFQEHLWREFEHHIHVEDAYDQLEYLLTADDADPAYQTRMRGIEWKTSMSFLRLIDRYIERLKSEGMIFRPFLVRDDVLISTEQLQELFYEKYSDVKTIHHRIDKMSEWILRELDLAENELFEVEYNKMLKSPKYLGSDDEMKAEAKRRVRKMFDWLEHMAKSMEFVDMQGMYRRLMTDADLMEKLGDEHEFSREELEAIGRYTLTQLESNIVPYEDATPILYFKSAFVGLNTYGQIRQVIIDEAQDYSPFQLEYFRRLFPRTKFTMLGDLNQGIYHANVQSYQMIGELFGVEEDEVEIIRLTKSYRSTTEIVEFTKRILPHGEPVEATSREGEEPQLIAVPSVEQLNDEIAKGIEEMVVQGTESLAVICQTAKETQEAYEALKSRNDREVHLITKNTRTFVSGVVFVPAYLAKGLEFDGVIVYNASKDVYRRESERKLLYTACTRAMHHLRVYYAGEPSSLLGK